MPKGTPEVFYRTMQFWKDVYAPPVFDCDGIHFLHIRRNRLYFVFSTKSNVSPTFYLELLSRIASVIEDYIGELTENDLRKNTPLVYDLIHEIIDSGYVESTSSEFLRDYMDIEANKASHNFLNRLSNLANQDVDLKTAMNVMTATGDLFVDVVENVQCVQNSEGQVTNSSLEGSLLVKNELSGHPTCHVQLHQPVSVGKMGDPSEHVLRVDDLNFHSCVDVAAFEREPCLHFVGPKGAFTAMNYRSTHPFFPPIRVTPVVEQPSEYKLDIVLKVSTQFAAELMCNPLLVSFHTPEITSSCRCELPEGSKKQTAEYSEMKHLVMWSIADAPGQQDFFLHVIVTLTQPCGPYTIKSMGPIAMNFAIRNMSLSGLAVDRIDIDDISSDPNAVKPNSWIKYIVKSSSYICRF